MVVATVLTVYGIETCHHGYHETFLIRWLQQHLPLTVCAEGCETAKEQSDDEVRPSQVPEQSEGKTKVIGQQYLPFMVCAVECETVEAQSDDEVRTSQVPERREGKTKVIKQQCLPFTVLKLWDSFHSVFVCYCVAIAPTVYGMRRRVRDSRGAKRR